MLPFRFDAAKHEYIALDNGQALPHITGMLEAAGLVNPDFFTDDGRERGTAVHNLTAAYDLEALEAARCKSRYRNYLLAHVACMQQVAPEILQVEEPVAHERYRFAGRPDRVVRIGGRVGVLEEKSGGEEKSHYVQTALQAILVAPELNLPAELVARWCLYLKPSGRFQLVEHTSRADIRAANRIIVACCGRAAAA